MRPMIGSQIGLNVARVGWEPYTSMNEIGELDNRKGMPALRARFESRPHRHIQEKNLSERQISPDLRYQGKTDRITEAGR